MGRNSLTQGQLKALLYYNPNTGCFINLKTGDQVGWLQSGYLKYEVLDKKYYLHRLAWLYMTGEFPPEELDHIDGDRSNNRFNNLREASRTQNSWNRRRRKDSLTGYKGVEFIRKLNKYRAVISHKGCKRRLGTFETAQEASRAYQREAEKLHGEWLWAQTH